MSDSISRFLEEKIAEGKADVSRTRASCIEPRGSNKRRRKRRERKGGGGHWSVAQYLTRNFVPTREQAARHYGKKVKASVSTQ